MTRHAHRAELARSPRAPAEARAMVAALRLDRRTAETVRLAVSELVSNAVMHGDGRITVSLSTVEDGVHIVVGDHGLGFVPAQEPVMPPPQSPGGRGLALIALLSDRWGVAPGDPTSVWCVIPRAA